MVVGVVERVACDLLALAGNTPVVVPERIAVWVAMEVGFGIFVSDLEQVKVLDIDGGLGHQVVAEGRLKFG